MIRIFQIFTVNPPIDAQTRYTIDGMSPYEIATLSVAVRFDVK